MTRSTTYVRSTLLGICAAGLFTASQLALAAPITVESNSYINSGSWVHVYWGHETGGNVAITNPGSGSVSSQHGPGNGLGHQFSTSTYSVTNPSAEEVDFDFTMNNTVDYGGYTVSRANYTFSLTGNTAYDLSGSYSASNLVSSAFAVTLKNVTTNTVVFMQNAVGSLVGAGLNGNLGAGTYELFVQSSVSAEGTYFWSNSFPLYGPTSFGTAGGSGTVHFDLTAEAVPEPAALSLLGLCLVGLGIARQRRRLV